MPRRVMGRAKAREKLTHTFCKEDAAKGQGRAEAREIFTHTSSKRRFREG